MLLAISLLVVISIFTTFQKPGRLLRDEAVDAYNAHTIAKPARTNMDICSALLSRLW